MSIGGPQTRQSLGAQKLSHHDEGRVREQFSVRAVRRHPPSTAVNVNRLGAAAHNVHYGIFTLVRQQSADTTRRKVKNSKTLVLMSDQVGLNCSQSLRATASSQPSTSLRICSAFTSRESDRPASPRSALMRPKMSGVRLSRSVSAA